jgi:hypothetical protein
MGGLRGWCIFMICGRYSYFEARRLGRKLMDEFYAEILLPSKADGLRMTKRTENGD